MREVDQCFPHVFVHVDGVCVFHELPDHLSLVVLHHQNLLRFGHPRDHDVSDFGEDRLIEQLSLLRVGRGRVGRANGA